MYEIEIHQHNCGKAGSHPARFGSVLRHIQENLGDDLDLSSLAKVAGLSPCYFARVFKEVTGLAPHQYLLEERIRRAEQLLSNSSARISTIAYELGFSSQAHFTVVFRQLTGTTPGAYRVACVSRLNSAAPAPNYATTPMAQVWE